jgi:NhaP-type Na+/H+ or K+/H+ antiporter
VLWRSRSPCLYRKIRPNAILVITFAVVAFSVFAQGLTITPLLRRLAQIK